jgi:hypothetical protein
MSSRTRQLTISQWVIKHLEASASSLFFSICLVITSIHFNPPPAINVLFTNVSYSYKPIISVTICWVEAVLTQTCLLFTTSSAGVMEWNCSVLLSPSMLWEPPQHCWREWSFTTRYSTALLVFVGLHLLGAVAALLPARTMKNTDALLVLIGLLIAYPYKRVVAYYHFPFLFAMVNRMMDGDDCL